jgi:hypothetical protein
MFVRGMSEETFLRAMHLPQLLPTPALRAVPPLAGRDGTADAATVAITELFDDGNCPAR